MFRGDGPISDPSLDMLNRAGFAHHLARAINDFPASSDGFVMALIGQWGSGKSSTISLVLRFLENQELLAIIKRQDEKFSGWDDGNIEHIRACYAKVEPKVRELEARGLDTSLWWEVHRDTTFRAACESDGELEDAILFHNALCKIQDRYRDSGTRRPTYRPTHKRRNVVVKFSPWMFPNNVQIASALLTEITRSIGSELGNEIAKDFSRLLASFAGLAKVLGASADALLPTFGFGSIFASATDSLQRRFEKLAKTPSLDQIRTRLERSLSKLEDQKLVVVIDDLDRLTPSEAASMVVAIKGLVGLPNVLYLLSYDEKVLDGLLTQHLGVSGYQFLEKIVQYPVHLPLANSEAILNLLNNNLSKLLVNPTTSVQSRLGLAWQFTLRHCLRTPRDVVRLINCYSVAMSAVGSQTDPVDLLLLEVIRLKEPNLYQWIRENLFEIVGT